MKKLGKILQVGFTYIGTIVGAGFATGQEILQFFTQYGWIAVGTIALSSLLLIWLGVKLMFLSSDLNAHSFEDLNRYLFGDRVGHWISLFTLLILFGITTVMLAGSGSIFSEHLHLPYQLGLFITLGLTYIVILNGMDAILVVNSIVVPVMILFSILVVWTTQSSPDAGNWLMLNGHGSMVQIWMSPFLYSAFNLAMGQAVLVPLGSTIKDKTILFWGGIMGGAGIGIMLLAGHYALSARMPAITQYDIPMGHMITQLGKSVQFFYLLVIYGEIFTTFIANIFGVLTQLQQKMNVHKHFLILIILSLCYFISQIGFKSLLSTLYPLFGGVSLIWFFMVIWRKRVFKS